MRLCQCTSSRRMVFTIRRIMFHFVPNPLTSSRCATCPGKLPTKPAATQRLNSERIAFIMETEARTAQAYLSPARKREAWRKHTNRNTRCDTRALQRSMVATADWQLTSKRQNRESAWPPSPSRGQHVPCHWRLWPATRCSAGARRRLWQHPAQAEGLQTSPRTRQPTQQQGRSASPPSPSC